MRRISNITKNIQTHHISYDPEVTIDILKELHVEYHGHGTGRAKGCKNPRKKVRRRKDIIAVESFINKYGQLYVPRKTGFDFGESGSVDIMGTINTLFLLPINLSASDALQSVNRIMEYLKYQIKTEELN